MAEMRQSFALVDRRRSGRSAHDSGGSMVANRTSGFHPFRASGPAYETEASAYRLASTRRPENGFTVHAANLRFVTNREKPPPQDSESTRCCLRRQCSESTLFNALGLGRGLAQCACKGRRWWRDLKEPQELIQQGLRRLVADVLAKGGAPRLSLRYCVALDGSFGRHRVTPR